MQTPKDFFHYRAHDGASSDHPSCMLNHMDEACSDIYESSSASYGASDIPKDFYSDFGTLWSAWRLGIPYYDTLSPPGAWDHYQPQLFGTDRTPMKHPELYNDEDSILFPKHDGGLMGYEGFDMPSSGTAGLIVVIFFIMFLLYRKK